MECMIPEFYTHSEPIARKQHVCVECCAPILKGEKHFAYRGKWDGQLETGRQHVACMEACMYIRDHMNDGECIGFGSLFNELGEMWWFSEDETRESHPKLRALIEAIQLREKSK